uniref:Chromosome X open reading frame 38 n=1 Tax=Nothobranchius kadleci TaxID=1051664 RepID=A0A1A8E9D5_NOTKA
MVLEELTVRLNDREYTNWLKAGRCLLILKTGLHPFTDHQMRAHHRDLLNQHALLSTPCETSSCKPIGNKLSSPCGLIQFRNELMHSCELRVKDDWIRHYWSTLKHFVQQLSDVPQMATVGQQIEDMLTVDLSICVSGVDRVDSDGPLEGCESDFVSQLETSAEKVSQWETELLQEMLQEYLHVAAEEDGDAKAQDPEQLKRLQSFLQANKDLREKFSTELQAINSLEVKE